ncbi:MAG: LptF/LptG family permease [Desulfovibrionaceae bacterium]|nr:LptF/LptG family permease [Desulfovibrionaceae bacterium]
MKTLNRYLLRQNLFLMFVCLGSGVGVYVLADLFDRLDDFLEAGLGAGTVLTYFVVKAPLMVSQLLPAVFLISAVLQLSIMTTSRETLALQAGGVSFNSFVRFFLVAAVGWAVVQLLFSQFLGVAGEEEARRIWKEQVREQSMEFQTLNNVWFKEGDRVVEMAEVQPRQGRGAGLTVYRLAPGQLRLKRIVRARTFTAAPGRWVLRDVSVFSPDGFRFQTMESMDMDLDQDVAAFLVIDPRTDPATLPLWRLGEVIDRLQKSGSNVETLRTVWHMKLAYAFSIVVMGLVALCLVSLRSSVYVNIGLGLVITFAFYGVFMLGVTAGQKGLLPPVMGAWAGNALFSLLATARIVWYAGPRS